MSSLYYKICNELKSTENINLIILELSCDLYQKHLNKQEIYKYLRRYYFDKYTIIAVLHIISCLNNINQPIIEKYKIYVDLIMAYK